MTSISRFLNSDHLITILRVALIANLVIGIVFELWFMTSLLVAVLVVDVLISVLFKARQIMIRRRTKIPVTITQRIEASDGKLSRKDEQRAQELAISSATGDAKTCRRILSGGLFDPTKDQRYHYLHLAAAGCHADVIELLLAAGLDPNQEYGRHTPLTLATHSDSNPELKRKAAQVLIDGGADTSISLYIALIRENIPAIKLLLELGADPNTDGTLGNGESTGLPLRVATYSQDASYRLAACRLLLDAGADAATVLDDGRTLLHGLSDPEIIRLFVASGADVNAPTRHEFNDMRMYPIDSAITLEDADACATLLELGADPRKRFAWGRTATCLSHNEKLSHVFNPPLHQAALQGRADELRSLLASGADVNSTTCLGLRPIDMAGSAEIIQVLVEHGANLNSRDDEGNTPLHNMANLSAVEQAIAMGADIFAANDDGRTPAEYGNSAKCDFVGVIQRREELRSLAGVDDTSTSPQEQYGRAM